MKKPKELIGKVRKFEDWYIRSISGMAGLPVQKTEDILNFYTQPFKPEMIEEYFEGWKLKPYLNNNSFLPVISPQKEVYYYDIHCHSIEDTFNDIVGLRIKTLSDFIDACINSNIELEWK